MSAIKIIEVLGAHSTAGIILAVGFAIRSTGPALQGIASIIAARQTKKRKKDD